MHSFIFLIHAFYLHLYTKIRRQNNDIFINNKIQSAEKRIGLCVSFTTSQKTQGNGTEQSAMARTWPQTCYTHHHSQNTFNT